MKKKMLLILVLSVLPLLSACSYRATVEVLSFDWENVEEDVGAYVYHINDYSIFTFPENVAYLTFESQDLAIEYAARFYKDEDVLYSAVCVEPDSFFRYKTWERLEAWHCSSGLIIVEYQ